GLSVLDVKQWLEAGEPPDRLVAMRGAFDPDGFASRLAACGECAPADVSEHRGWPVYGWGEESGQDLGRRLQPPLFDHLGRGGRFALSDHLNARTPGRDAIHAVIDAYEGQGSLADVDEFRLSIAALEEAGTLALLATDRKLNSKSLTDRPVDGAESWEVQPGDT